MQSFISASKTARLPGIPLVETLESRDYFAVDLSAVISVVSPASRQVKPGQSLAVQVVVKNVGDAAAKGPLSILLGVSSTADGLTPVVSIGTSKPINLKPGAQKSFRLSAKVPAGFVPGTYFATAKIDAANTFAETSLENNFAIAAAPVTVLSPFPDISGTFTGTITIVSGLHKGVSFQASSVYTEDDATGTFTQTALYTFSDGSTDGGSGTGTISAKGVVAEDLVDVPADNLGTSVNKAKLTGNVLKGTFIDAADHGKYTFTRTG